MQIGDIRKTLLGKDYLHLKNQQFNVNPQEYVLHQNTKEKEEIKNYIIKSFEAQKIKSSSKKIKHYGFNKIPSK